MGATNPENAEEGTVRKAFGLNVQENSVHGSDSPENAEKEIRFFFSDIEIVG
jgi:nucleoside-diphosphate kinase